MRSSQTALVKLFRTETVGTYQKVTFFMDE